jgi:hypothetical protein
MGLPRTVILFCVGPFAVGCASLHDARHAALQTVGLETPTPASEFACAWQNKLAQLPDPTKNGATITGLPGQMFLFAPDGGDKLKPAVPTGELTISVIDETPRSAGYPKKPNEIWHFTRDKLEQMQATDERFGKNFVLFIPWPENWRDVSRVRILSRYDQKVNGQTTTLYGQESLVTLDFVTAPGANPWGAGMAGNRPSVPNPNAIMNQMKSAGQAQQAAHWANQPVVPVSATNPIPPQTPARPSVNSAAPNAGMVVPANLP